jgi:hypothetical protein
MVVHPEVLVAVVHPEATQTIFLESNLKILVPHGVPWNE